MVLSARRDEDGGEIAENILQACGTGPVVLYPESQMCSGRGQLNPPVCTETLADSRIQSLSACVCNDSSLWTGAGDLLYGAPTCALSVPAIQVLYGLLGLVATLSVVFTLRYVLGLMRLHRRKGRRLSRLSWSVAIGGILSSTSFAVLGFYRVARPSSAVGTDAVATSLVNLGALGFTFMHVGYDCSLFTLGFAHAGLAQDRSLRARLREYTVIHMTLALLLIALIQSLLIQTKHAFDVVVPMFLVGHALLTLFIGLLFTMVAPSAMETIRQNAGEQAKVDGPLRTVLKQIDDLTRSMRSSCAFIVAISVLFAAWEGLRQVAYPYVFALVWVLSQVSQVQCMIVLQTISGFASSVRAARPGGFGGATRNETEVTTPVEIRMNEPTRSIVHTEFRATSSSTQSAFASNNNNNNNSGFMAPDGLSMPASTSMVQLDLT